MNGTDYILQGILEAQERHEPTVEEEYAVICARAAEKKVMPYVPPEEDNGELSPDLKRSLKIFQVAAPTVAISAGLCHVLMSGALNTALGWAIGILAGGAALSGLRGGSTGGNSSNSSNSSGRKITVEQHQKTTVEL